MIRDIAIEAAALLSVMAFVAAILGWAHIISNIVSIP